MPVPFPAPATRGTDVFFYDLLMDPQALRARGLAPANTGIALLHDYVLQVGTRATLLQRQGGRVYGVVAWLPLEHIRQLYCGSGYQPEAVLVDDPDYLVRPALCFNLAAAGVGDAAHLARIVGAARRLGLPDDYLENIGASRP